MVTDENKYRINLFSLNFKEKNIKEAFSKSFFKEDLYALRFVITLGIILSFVFIFIDMNKYKDPWISIAFRGGMAFCLGVFAYLSFLINADKYHFTQIYAIIVSSVVITGFYIHYHFNTDPNFDIFLPNILTVLVYIIATITGLRFRFAFWIISISIFAYFIYIPLFNYSDIAARQTTQMVVVYLFTILSSYVLERQKINLFINRAILAEEKEKVESLNAVKNKLFSIISHDLRSPITSLKGIVSLLNKEAVTKEEFKNLSKNLEEKLTHTSYLMDNLLAWSKSQMDGLVLNKTTFPFKEELINIIDSFKVELEKKSIHLRSKFNDDLFINADKEMMQIVIRNLLSNAIKFTPENGIINIEGYSDNNLVHLFVKDNGNGISKEKQRYIFNINKSNLIGTVHTEGAGLGLLLVKEFTEYNDGSITCESTLGKGTQFILRFPSA